MSKTVYLSLLTAIALLFTGFFIGTVVPPLLVSGDVVAAALAGFVNPFAAGYATDVILCWVVLLLWIVYEAKVDGVRHGWICILLGAVPGVAVGMSCYLILRHQTRKALQ
ncbi:hypothetical protein GCM10008090_05690 [Arenicella chitinivorans]|uniref:DUF2834 domain-containing protein n=1 Tax=Arenicella chitinivorans TaxID=1329800 RepID=A0A918RI82_9GAMM|nr:DUF2834 domain-containing protein [Arenicella chitinivorans]GGZ99899.1 hypothetical protein GCM10008090_05690 [Arenicella chitinivorans]